MRKTLMKNYRTISILPVVSKIIENVMHTQLMDYITFNKLFTSQQYGYRANRSTELSALKLMDRNLDNINRNLKTLIFQRFLTALSTTSFSRR